MSSDFEEQEDELLALQSIFSPQEFGRNESKVGGEIRVCVDVPAGFTVATKEGKLKMKLRNLFLFVKNKAMVELDSDFLWFHFKALYYKAIFNAKRQNYRKDKLRFGLNVVLFFFFRWTVVSIWDIVPSSSAPELWPTWGLPLLLPPFLHSHLQLAASHSGKSEPLLPVTLTNGDRESAIVAEDQQRLHQSICRLLPQISVLGAQLIDIYQATRGAVVLFTWVQFLKEDALRFLDIENLLELPCDDHTSQNCRHAANQQPDNHPGPDAGTSHKASCNLSGHCEGGTSALSDLSASASSEPRAGKASLSKSPGNSQEEDQPISPPFLSPTQRLVSQILINDATQQQRRFASTVFDCGVCFTGYLGSDCVKLPECGHIFCRGCLSEFCKVLITEGNIRGVTCPQADCSSAPTPAQVRASLCIIGQNFTNVYSNTLIADTCSLIGADPGGRRPVWTLWSSSASEYSGTYVWYGRRTLQALKLHQCLV